MQRRGYGMRAGVVRLGAAVIATAILAAAPRPASGADPYREVSLQLGQGLVALFPAVEGYVVSASGDEVYVDLASKDLLQPGMELQVYRPGGEMVHPVTKQVLGTYEKSLGVLRLTEVREKYSRGVLDSAGAASGIVPGDRVRLSARRLRALLHVSGAAPGIEIGPLAQALLARGEESGRFAMVDEPAWAPSLAALGAPWETVGADPAALRRLGELAAADLLLQARIQAGPVPGVAVEVRSLRTGAVLGELSQRWPTAPGAPVAAAPAAARASVAAAPAPAEPPAAAAAAAPSAPAAPAVAAPPAPPAAAEKAQASRDSVARDLSSPARGLAAGDIIGEGKVEVLLTDGVKLALYRWEPQSLVWRWDEEGRGGRRVLSLDAADVDGDGQVEVMVTTVKRGRVTSELRRWRDGALRVAGTIDGVYLRACARAGASPVLLGQRSGIGEVVAGRVEQYRLREGVIERVEGSALPKGVGIFGLALAPAEGPVVLYSLDRAGYISGLDAKGAALWRSTRPYGGYPSPLPAAELFGQVVADDPEFEEQMRAFQGRLLARPGPDGVRLIVPRNFSDSPVTLPRMRSFGQGEVVVFEGAPVSLEETRRSRAYDGYVADVALADIDGDGVPEVLFAVNRFAGPLLGERGKLVAWRPNASPPAGK